jgi:hypothetical protein
MPSDVGAFFSAKDNHSVLDRDATTEPQYPVNYIVIATQADRIAEARGCRWDASQRTFVLVVTLPGDPPCVS